MSNIEIATNGNVPSNPSDRKEIATKIDEIVEAEQRIADQRSFIKDVKNILVKDFELNPAQVKCWVSMRKERNRDEVEITTQETLDGFDLLFPSSPKDAYNNVSDATMTILDTDED